MNPLACSITSHYYIMVLL